LTRRAWREAEATVHVDVPPDTLPGLTMTPGGLVPATAMPLPELPELPALAPVDALAGSAATATASIPAEIAANRR
jgi:hypothetical protein